MTLATQLVHRLCPGVIEVKYLGRLGNVLGQYCFARMLAERLGFALSAEPIAGFPGVRRLGRRLWRYLPAHRLQLIGGGHRIDVEALLADRTPRLIVQRGYFLRYEYFRPMKQAIRGSWLVPDVQVAPPPADSLTIHVRSGDIWQKQEGAPVHSEYAGLPFSFYARIIGLRAWSGVTVVTDDPGDPMVRKLSETFGATVRSQSALEDFAFLRASANLVLSVSTYAWWAAWLSRAERIFYPLAGLFDPQRARRRSPQWQQDLFVDDEPRYLPVVVPTSSTDWRGTADDRRRLLAS
jgi:hypothetical protein